MFLVVNRCYGGFELPNKFCEVFGWNRFDSDMSIRTNTYLVDYILRHGYKIRYTDLQVVEIPDYATDYMVTDCDGKETVIYVVDGKIKWL